MKPVLAIVGRPNVGKSTLFNRLVGERRSITDPTPGVTRDRIYGEVEWLGHEFVAIDTGGWQDDAGENLSRGKHLTAAIREQVQIALAASDAVLMVVDGREGITALDEQVADLLRSLSIPVILGVNKVDATAVELGVPEFYALGLGDPIPFSAEHGRNTGDLLDAVIAVLPYTETMAPAEESPIRVAIVGRPNVGKSSIMNALLQDDRVMVSEVPGTTRDAVEVMWEWEGQQFTFVDTAGLRRRARIDEQVEHYSVASALRAIRKCDVALLVLDSEEMVTEQDQRVANYIQDQGKAAIVVVNKWDLVESDPYAWMEYEAIIRDRLYYIEYALTVSTSAKDRQRIARLPQLVVTAYRNYRTPVKTRDLNRIVREITERHEPPAKGGRKLRIYYGTQVAYGPPTFLFFVNEPLLVTKNYRRYMERRLREALELVGTPVHMIFRKSE